LYSQLPIGWPRSELPHDRVERGDLLAVRVRSLRRLRQLRPARAPTFEEALLQIPPASRSR
jgi:hypothetical protein